jgi:hypothetical protein
MNGFETFNTSIESTKAWSIAWIVLTGLGVLILLSGGASKRGGGATALGCIGLLLVLPNLILNAKLLFAAPTSFSEMNTLSDMSHTFAVLTFVGQAMVILAVIVAKSPHRTANPNIESSAPERL